MSKLTFALLAASVLLGYGGRTVAADPELKFEIYKDKADEYRWRLKGETAKSSRRRARATKRSPMRRLGSKM